MTESLMTRPKQSRQSQIPGNNRRTRGNTDSSQQEARESRFNRALLSLEQEVRKITDERELAFHLCNASHQVLQYDQCLYGVTYKGCRGFRLLAASGTQDIDRNSPFTTWIEARVLEWLQSAEPDQQQLFRLHEEQIDPDYSQLISVDTEILWTPQVNGATVIGGVVLLRRHPWSEPEHNLAQRLATLYTHGRAAIKGFPQLTAKRNYLRPVATTALIALMILSFLPVRISALAPVEVTAAQPYIISAPFDGVVKTIVPDQGQALAEGDVTVQFDDIHLLNDKLLSEQRMAVSQARFHSISQQAIADPRAKRNIEVARAEYELAKSETEYASELYNMATLKAPLAGVAIFSDKQDWEGRPVAAGEAILSVAKPDLIELSINLPIKESIVLQEGARVKVFLDSDPLTPLEATLTELSYSATPDKRGILSYRLKAKLSSGENPSPRIGIQGTAQIIGPQSTLGYKILRRPYNAVRQLTGW